MKKIIIRITTALLIATSISTTTALAQSDMIMRGANDKGEVTTPLADPLQAYGLLGDLIGTIIAIIIFGGAATAFIFFIIGAIQWGTAAGGDGAAKGRLTMIYSAAGLIMLGLVYVVILIYNQLVA